MRASHRVARLLVVLAGSLALAAIYLVAPQPALAYGGPGSVVTGIGALLALLAAIAATVLGLLWFPLKRLVKTIRLDDEEDSSAE